MSLVSRSVFSLLAGLVTVPMSPVVHQGPTNVPVTHDAAPVTYDARQKEFYLTEDQLAYIRPGLHVKLGNLTNVAPGQHPVVEVFITDDLGIPLDRMGGSTPGPVTIRCVIGTWDAATRRYTNLLLASGAPSKDSTGTYTDFGTGHFTYTFAAALPSFDVTVPVTIAVLGRRVTTPIVGKDFWSTPVYFDVTPSTGGTAATFNATTVARCNQCHDPLAEHGGNYRDIKTCVLCHNPNNMTGANTHLDGQIFFHALHQGKDATVGNVTYPQDIRNCATCHDAKAAGGASWFTFPSVAACGSCHNTLDFVTGANHPAGPAADGTCASCHTPQGNHEWDPGIIDAHTIPLKSSQLKGLVASIVSVTNVGPGTNIVVTFTLANGDGSFVNPGTFGTNLNILLGGPTTDYAINPFREGASGAMYDATTNLAVYTFKNAIPGTATGTWAVSIEARRSVALNPAPTNPAGGGKTVNEGAVNPTTYIAVTDPTPVPRRTIVSLAACNTCHDNLEILFSHGNQRITIEHCVICHNPNADDSSLRPASANPPESISFKRLIHRIHTGTDLTQDFTIYGFGGTANNFNDVTYPGDRRDCAKCHTSIVTAELPTGGTLDTVTLRDYFTPQGPATAACLGCHDLRDFEAHAYLNTAPFGEACTTCHGEGATYAVDVVHAQ
jgi:OmcA/MtrC family decaheme c-type cytochrome